MIFHLPDAPDNFPTYFQELLMIDHQLQGSCQIALTVKKPPYCVIEMLQRTTVT